jgi:PIN domain nuclease of toxin-antitoxin system
MSSLATTPLKPFYVIDTHTLIWYLTTSRQLSPTASQIFEAAERGETRLVISAITVAELFYANQKNAFLGDFAVTYRQMKTKPYFRFVALTADAVLDFDQDMGIREMHDRIIVGLARRLGAPLLTADRQITAAQVVEVVW